MNLSEVYLKKQEEWQQEGEERGEQRKALEIALNMLRRDLSVTLIADLTGLTVEEIEQLREQV